MGMLNLHHTARVFLAVQLDRRVPWWLKVSAWGGMFYVFSPLDILPELFTGIGLLDDIIFSLIIMQAFLEAAPQHVVEEHCARLNLRADQVFISVPQTIRQARSLYVFATEFGASFRDSVSSAGRDEPREPFREERAEANGPANTTIEPAAGSRYSAYRNGDPNSGKEPR